MVYTVIAYSLLDIAGRGIAKNIIELSVCHPASAGEIADLEGVVESYICKDGGLAVLGFSMDTVELDVLGKLGEAVKEVIVVSRHSAKSGRPSLTTHTPGNPWGRNDAGGKPWEIPPSNPVLMWHILRELYKKREEQGLQNYEACYEVTHHGPTSVTRPITFVELGSSEKEWIDVKAQRAVAHATLSALYKAERSEANCIVTVGFGGTHYAPLFTRRALEEHECYGHMVPGYVIKELTLDELRSVAKKVIEMTPGCQRVVIEKMRRDVRNVIEEVASSSGLEVVRY
uniref:D-aminoacyl-tRNA deacylase n=1 Tax=Ignisphaera aggregans TaxID=334771 RepID=A0A7C2VND6_9CREN